MINKVGKNTPVWRNRKDGRVVCGKTVQEALGVGWMFDVGKDWYQVVTLLRKERVIIKNGSVLPVNPVTSEIASTARSAGPIKVKACGQERTYNILYVDAVRVIVE